MSEGTKYIPFSQRNGLSPIPTQLKIGEITPELRRLLEYCFVKELEREVRYGDYFNADWKVVATDFHVKFLRKSINTFSDSGSVTKRTICSLIENASLGLLFDLVEFFARHPNCSTALKTELAVAFESSRSAYRVFDGQIVAVGTAEQAKAFETAIAITDFIDASAARRHLIASGAALRSGSWADSVRESIHAVESMARRINPAARTLGEALKTLERNGYIHGSLKLAFEKLYGYTNDENGIRHALSEANSRVDEVDALFMLGACASFVSYLVAREASHQDNKS